MSRICLKLLGLFFLQMGLSACAELEPLSMFSNVNHSLVEEAVSETKKGEAVADAFFKQGQYEAALEIYENILDRTELDDRAPILLKHGQAANAAGLHLKAVKSFEKLSYYVDHKCPAYVGLGKVQMKLGKPKTANETFAACLNIEEEHKEASEWFALSKLFLSKDPQTVLYLKKLANQNPTDLFRQNNFAVSLILHHEFEKAKQHLEIYAFSKISNRQVRHNLALTYALMGDEDASRYVSLLDMPPEAATTNLTYYRYIRQSKNEEALHALLLGVAK
ncbi:tetratricopeptide repeat protein [Sneathiella sp. P13V-1]|uniref:tetratricopeptide repeat protein n=1 Tax=Sneathiella sp. P13V-1 TaxID=2697366 RepID=UPI00187B5CB3|nr:tetratricopeptide repeat protein [Sneathiella sp. P13V-1]MBE7637289.1 tetratricopeptide repeat protein [Sneathiella sp. P13V-1]